MKALRVPLFLFALPAVLLRFAPGSASGLLYDRTAILNGEWWRLWTGHWVHFSPSHLGWNLVVLLGAGTWLESLRPGALLRYTLAAAPLISGALLVAEPAMQTYGGLSALAVGGVAVLACVQCDRPQADRIPWCGLLLLLGAKIAYDATHVLPLFSRFAGESVRASAWAHAAGAASALIFYSAAFERIRFAFCLAQPGSRK